MIFIKIFSCSTAVVLPRPRLSALLPVVNHVFHFRMLTLEKEYVEVCEVRPTTSKTFKKVPRQKSWYTSVIKQPKEKIIFRVLDLPFIETFEKHVLISTTK